MSTRLWDAVIVVASILLSGYLWYLDPDPSDRLVGTLVIAGTAGTFVSLNHSLFRRPNLVVEYRNHAYGDRPVWDGTSTKLHVVVLNRGRGPAEAVEVRFDDAGASDVWNESGNWPEDLDVSVVPPRFKARDRVMESSDEWTIARLSFSGSMGAKSEPSWEARARGMATKRGSVRIERRDETG